PAEDRAGVLVETLAHLGPEELHHRRLGSDLLAARKPGQRARVVQTEDLDVHPGLRELLTNQRVGGRAAVDRAAPEEVARDLVEDLLLPHEARAALVRERRPRDTPAVVLHADQILGRDGDLVEEDLVELALARD